MLSNKSKKKIRIRDLAKLANVSTGTVDRVLHNRGEVKEETKIKVLRIIDAMNYTPNLTAKALASKKTFKLVILVPDSSDINPYWEKPVLGINQAFNEISHFRTDVDIYTFDAYDEKSFEEMTIRILNEKPQGIIFNPVFFKASHAFIKKLEPLGIPYIFIDMNLKGASNIAYFGQEAFKSGYLSGKLMNFGLKCDSSLLIVKLADNRVISRHIKNREKGFRAFFEHNTIRNCYNIFDLEIDLLEKEEPDKSLFEFLNKQKIDGIFVPNSRVFKLAQFFENKKINDILLIGYDLIPQNIKYLEEEKINFLIGQRPEEQAYKALKTLFNHIVLNKKVKKQNYSPIDIITKENIEFYKEFRNE